MYSRLLLAQIKLNQEGKVFIVLGKIAIHLLINVSSLFFDVDLKKCGIEDENVLYHFEPKSVAPRPNQHLENPQSVVYDYI